MKKIVFLIIFFVTFFFFNTHSYGALIDILYKSGGKLGEDGKTRYGKVIEINLFFIRVVSCTGAGDDICPENGNIQGVPPDIMGNVNEAREFAKNKIRNNQLSGQVDLPNGLSVKWFSVTNNPENCGECEVKIWTTGEPEPFKENYISE